MKQSLASHQKPIPPESARRLQIESKRAAELHRVFTRINRRPSRHSITRRLAMCAHRLNGRPIKGIPGETWKLSKATVHRLWLQWHRGDKTPAALVRKYTTGCGHSRLTTDHVRGFIEIVSQPETRSGIDGFRKLCGRSEPPASYSAFMRRLGPGATRRIVRARRFVRNAEQVLESAKQEIESHATAIPLSAAEPVPPAPSYEI